MQNFLYTEKYLKLKPSVYNLLIIEILQRTKYEICTVNAFTLSKPDLLKCKNNLQIMSSHWVVAYCNYGRVSSHEFLYPSHVTMRIHMNYFS